MGMVMIKCPESGNAIPTGIETDRDNFRRSIVFFSRTYCRICATKHEWFAREAWVYESVFANEPCGGGRSPGGGAA